MPIKHAAVKQLRKDRKLRQRNQTARAELKTLTRRFLSLLTSQKLDEAATLLRMVAKKYDHAASRGIVHRNAATRTGARLSRRLHQRRSAAPTTS